MKHIFSCIALLILVTSCAVKDETLMKKNNPNSNVFFPEFLDEELYASQTAIWVEELSYVVEGANVTVCGMCCSNYHTATIQDHVAYAIYNGAKVTVVGLEPNTTYSCRAFFTTSDNTTYYSQEKLITTKY